MAVQRDARSVVGLDTVKVARRVVNLAFSTVDNLALAKVAQKAAQWGEL